MSGFSNFFYPTLYTSQHANSAQKDISIPIGNTPPSQASSVTDSNTSLSVTDAASDDYSSGSARGDSANNSSSNKAELLTNTSSVDNSPPLSVPKYSGSSTESYSQHSFCSVDSLNQSVEAAWDDDTSATDNNAVDEIIPCIDLTTETPTTSYQTTSSILNRGKYGIKRKRSDGSIVPYKRDSIGNHVKDAAGISDEEGLVHYKGTEDSDLAPMDVDKQPQQCPRVDSSQPQQPETCVTLSDRGDSDYQIVLSHSPSVGRNVGVSRVGDLCKTEETKSVPEKPNKLLTRFSGIPYSLRSKDYSRKPRAGISLQYNQQLDNSNSFKKQQKRSPRKIDTKKLCVGQEKLQDKRRHGSVASVTSSDMTSSPVSHVLNESKGGDESGCWDDGAQPGLFDDLTESLLSTPVQGSHTLGRPLKASSPVCLSRLL